MFFELVNVMMMKFIKTCNLIAVWEVEGRRSHKLTKVLLYRILFQIPYFLSRKDAKNKVYLL